MRKGTTFDVIHIVKKAGAFETEASPPQQHQQHVLPSAQTTGWKSPVPYLFGGLAAMFGLIAFALLVLACSYWKLSGNFDDNLDEEAGGEGEEKVKGLEMKMSTFENSILVIMAGDEKPSFLATPATSRTTSFGDSEGKLSSCSCSSSSSGDCSDSCGGDDEKKEVKLTTEFVGS